MDTPVGEGPQVPRVPDQQAVGRGDFQDSRFNQVADRRVTRKTRQIALRVWQRCGNAVQLIECALFR